jgi:hypothetical protein
MLEKEKLLPSEARGREARSKKMRRSEVQLM